MTEKPPEEYDPATGPLTWQHGFDGVGPGIFDPTGRTIPHTDVEGYVRERRRRQEPPPRGRGRPKGKTSLSQAEFAKLYQTKYWELRAKRRQHVGKRHVAHAIGISDVRTFDDYLQRWDLPWPPVPIV